jgi:hypothetical protein
MLNKISRWLNNWFRWMDNVFRWIDTVSCVGGWIILYDQVDELQVRVQVEEQYSEEHGQHAKVYGHV